MLLVAMVASAPGLAGADQGPRQATPMGAKESFDAAQALYDAGRYADAFVLFQRAYEPTKSPNAHLMMARCLKALGQPADAYEVMAVTLKEATSLAESQPKYVATRDAAAAELALLERRVGKVVVALSDPRPPVARVTLNGRVIGPDRLGVPIAVTPGVSVVELADAGREAARRSVEVGAGEVKTVVLSNSKVLPAEARVAAIGAPATPSALVKDRGSSTGIGAGRAVGFALSGLGVAGMVVFGVAGAAADTKFAAVEEACGRARCVDPAFGPIVDSGKALDTAANAGLVVGIVGLASGSLLIALGGSRSGGARVSAAVSASMTGGSLGVKGTF